METTFGILITDKDSILNDIDAKLRKWNHVLKLMDDVPEGKELIRYSDDAIKEGKKGLEYVHKIIDKMVVLQ